MISIDSHTRVAYLDLEIEHTDREKTSIRLLRRQLFCRRLGQRARLLSLPRQRSRGLFRTDPKKKKKKKNKKKKRERDEEEQG